MGRLTRTRGGRFAPATEEALASLDDVSVAIGNLQARMVTMEGDMAEIKSAIAELRDLANMGRGGWVVLVKQGAIISALIGAGAAISALWQRIA